MKFKGKGADRCSLGEEGRERKGGRTCKSKIEGSHDASLSRQDAYFGNDYSFSQAAFDQVLAHFAGSTKTNISSASMGKYARVQDSRAVVNP